MQSEVDLAGLVAGLGQFLYGMHQLEAAYERLKSLEGEIVSFAIHMQQDALQEEEATTVERYLYVVQRDILLQVTARYRFRHGLFQRLRQ